MKKKGIVTKESGSFKVEFERIFNHPIEKVWDAITNPKKLMIWFTDFEMELKPKSKIKIIYRDAVRTVTMGEVIEVKPPYRFVWSWEGELAVWDLARLNDNSCKLVFTYSKLNEQYAVGASAGFHTVLERLEKYLQGHTGTYPFGTEEFDPEQIHLREEYGEFIYDDFPELEKFHPVKLEKVFKVTKSQLWEALTDREVLRKWYFDLKEDFKLIEGQVFEWNAGPPDRQWLHKGQMLEIIPQNKLVHSWEYPGYEGEARLTWELIDQGPANTLLKLNFEFIRPFDFKEEALRRKNFAKGWRELVFNSLAGLFDEARVSK